MFGYVPTDYGDRMADIYDDLYSWYEPTAAQLDRIDALADGGPVLEMGAGTGRLAVPLAERGIEVRAVDSSPAMLKVLREKAAGLPVHPVVGDAARFTVGRPLALVLAAFNFITLLPGRTDQQEFLRQAAGMLKPGGALVVELFVPRDGTLPGADGLKIVSLSAAQVVLEAGRHHRGAQRCEFHHIVLRDREPVRLIPATMHYLFPEQLDALADRAGLRLEERTADWKGRPFTEHSASHVSVYRRA